MIHISHSISEYINLSYQHTLIINTFILISQHASLILQFILPDIAANFIV